MKKHVILVLTFLLSFSVLFAQNWNTSAKFSPSDKTLGDTFGCDVSISGNYAIVGASGEDEDANGSNTLSNAGSAYIFFFNGSEWVEQQKIVASDREADDNFGFKVDISGDYAIVGAFREASSAGAAYIFVRNGSTWSEQQKIVASDRTAGDRFAYSLDIDGDYAIVGAYLEDDNVAGADTKSNAGSAYIFYRSGVTWTQQQKILAGDRAIDDYFGFSVSISGDYSIVGAYREDEDASGLNTLSNSGSAYIFIRSGVTWTQQQKIVAGDRAGNENFAYSVAISGPDVIVGAYNDNKDENGSNPITSAGSAFIFVRSGTTWTQQQKIVAFDRASYDNYGGVVSISGDYSVVGSFYSSLDANGENYMEMAGAAYVYSRFGSNWTLDEKLADPDRADYTYYGTGAVISGNTLIIGSPYALGNFGTAFLLNRIADEGGDGATPVELVGFTALNINNGVTLSWSTESEVNNLGFVIEKRKAGTCDWGSVSSYLVNANLLGQGTTSETHHYELTDNNVEPGCVYEYRLGDVDYDNDLTWKMMIEVELKEENIAKPLAFGLQKIYPNPFNPRTTFCIQLETSSNMDLSIFNTSGEKVTTIFNGEQGVGESLYTWDAANMPSGLYIVRMVTGNLIQSQKIVYMK
jgi:FG-GAP repeat/Secretion system C-terminal sorting domain